MLYVVFGVTRVSTVLFFLYPGGFVACVSCVVVLLPVDRLGGPERSFSFSWRTSQYVVCDKMNVSLWGIDVSMWLFVCDYRSR